MLRNTLPALAKGRMSSSIYYCQQHLLTHHIPFIAKCKANIFGRPISRPDAVTSWSNTPGSVLNQEADRHIKPWNMSFKVAGCS